MSNQSSNNNNNDINNNNNSNNNSNDLMNDATHSVHIHISDQKTADPPMLPPPLPLPPSSSADIAPPPSNPTTAGVISSIKNKLNNVFSADPQWENQYSAGYHPRAGILFKGPRDNLMAIIRVGIMKSQLSLFRVILLGLMAGCYIGIGGSLALAFAGGLSGLDTNTMAPSLKSFIQKLSTAVSFPFGLMMIVVAGAELFTGNVMFMTSAVYAKKIPFFQLIRVWCISYLANFAGCAFFAFFFDSLYTTNIEQGLGARDFLFALLQSKTSMGWGVTVIKAIACNWFVCLALWGATAADDFVGKIVACWWPIMAFVVIGFEHSIANMFYLSLALIEGGPVSFGTVLANNIIPVTIGNIIGGLFFITVQTVAYGPYFNDNNNNNNNHKQKSSPTKASIKHANQNRKSDKLELTSLPNNNNNSEDQLLPQKLSIPSSHHIYFHKNRFPLAASQLLPPVDELNSNKNNHGATVA